MFMVKRRLLFNLVLLTFVLLGIPLGAFAQNNVLNMPQFGKQIVNVSDELTFYDTKGEDDISSSSSNNAFSTVVFKPATSGKAIQIVFESVDVHNDGSSWPAYLNIYDGIFDPDNTITYPTTTSGVSGSVKFPTTDALLASLDGTYSNLTYISSTSDGALSVCFHFKYAKKSKGWVAKVREVTLTDMKIVSANANSDGVVASVYPGKKNVVLGNLNISTDGIKNADNLTSISFNLPKNDNVIDPTTIGLYDGDKAIETTLSQNGSENKLTFNKALSSGENNFTLKANIKDDAKFESTLQFAISKITTTAFPDGYTALQTIEPITLEVAPTILMSSGHKDVTVGSKKINFYDDGGPDGTISEGFNGSVTFIPENSGKKVQITFNSIDLFNTSSVGKNDILKIYYGKEINEANLAATLLKEKTATIKSIAEDGSLTVSLVSSTGTGFKNGFESIVEEFEPQSMKLDLVTVSQDANGKIAAGAKESPILKINITTSNTEPALILNSMEVSSNSTFALISKASVYYGKGIEDFSSAKKIGEVDVTANEFSIPLSSSLLEGNNWLWLAVDVKDEALNGQSIDASLKSVTLSSTKHTVENGDPEGNFVIENIFNSTSGTTTKTIFGDWTYKNTPKSSYDTGYDGTAGNQIVCFVPGENDKIIELDFSKFKITYPSSTYGDQPSFKVFSGKDATGTPLWECTRELKDVGPNSKLRSKSADGAITVLFNPNGVSGSSAGWVANVSQYKSVPMAVDSVIAFQASTDIIPTTPVAKNQEIIGFRIKTKGDQSPLSFESLKLDLKGCQDIVDSVFVYTSNNVNSLVKTNPISKVKVDGTSAEINLALTNPISLPEDNTYYWVAYDLKKDVKSERSIDAKLVSVNISDKAYTPIVSDPEGQRVTKNIYLIESGNGHTVTVGDETIMFYDDGGVDGKITKGFAGSVTFEPSSAGKVIQLTLKKWDIGANDKMTVSYGGEVKTTPDVKLSNTSVAGSVITSLSDDGKLTVDFSCPSYTSYLGTGWEIEVSQYSLKPLTLEKIAAKAVNESQLLRGSNDNQMICVKAVISGDKGNYSFNKFKLDLSGTNSLSDISNIKIYATDTVSTFLAKNLYGEIIPTSNDIEISGDYKITLPGEYKFWVSYDINPNATLYDSVKGKIVGATANASEDVAISASAQAVASIKQGISGVFVVGSSANANYATLTAAVEALKGGIDGPVTIEIEKGTYNEKLMIKDIKGTSPTNTISFKSQSGNYQDVVIEENKYVDSEYSDDKLYYEYGVVTVKGVDYVTFDGVTIQTSDVKYPQVVRLQDGSKHFSLLNSKVTAPMSIDYSSGDIYLFSTYVQSKHNEQVNHDITLKNTIFEGGYIGMMGGSQWITNDYEKGLTIDGCKFINQGSKAIYLSKSNGANIVNNSIINNATTKTDFSALDIDAENLVNISNNNIKLATQNYASAMFIRTIAAKETAPALISNNEINIACGGSSASYGIKLNSPSSFVDILYNTIRMTGNMTSSANFFSYDVHTGAIKVENNIFQNEAKGYVYRANKATYLTNISFANNSLYTEGTKFAYVAGDIADYAGWQTQSKEANSVIGKVDFLSENILMPVAAGSLNSAKVNARVTTDITGALRSTATPTIGAYEFTTNLPIPQLVEGYPKVFNITHISADVVLKATKGGMVTWKVLPATATVPTADELISAGEIIEIRPNEEVTLKATGLEKQTLYKTYLLFSSLLAENSAVIDGGTFTTTYDPTEVSTFENPVQQDGYFTDGTAKFEGFTLLRVTDAVVDGNQVAKLGTEKGVITVTNSQKGLPLTGFFMKNVADVQITVYDQDNKATSYTKGSSNTKWEFFNLKDKGLITKVELSSADEALIDNFSGVPNKLYVFLNKTTINEGEAATLKVTLNTSLGVAPYSYEWTVNGRAVVGTEASLIISPIAISKVVVKVTDAWGDSDTSEGLVTVLGSAKTATFEEMPLETETSWNGDTPKDSDMGTTTYWYSGSYEFTAFKHTSTWWSGYACTNETSTAFTSLKDQYRSAAGGAHNSTNYSTAYPENLKIKVTNKTDGDSIRGFYITNAAYAKNVIDDGDGFGSSSFTTGDYFKLTIKGEKADGSISSKDYYLADYRSNDTKDHYVIDTWQWCDLRELGVVKNVSFSFSGSQSNSYGLLTPTYLCMDDFNGYRNIVKKEKINVPLYEKSFELPQYFDLEPEGSVVYKVEDAYNNEALSVSIENDKLLLTGKIDKTDVPLIISATQKGKIQFAELPIYVDKYSSNEDVNIKSLISIYPNPVTTALHISTSLDDYSVEIYTLNGEKVFEQTNNSGSITILRDGWANGMYLIKVYNGSSSQTEKFIVK